MTDDRAPVPSLGDRWAYRKGMRDELAEVEVLRVGTRRPARVLVRFIDDAYEGLRDWVPPARLRVPWPEREAFLERERRWDALVAPSPDSDDATLRAADDVIETLIAHELASIGYSGTSGTLAIHDVDGLAARLELDPSALRTDPRSFEEGGDLHVPWPVTEMIARRLVELDPDRIMRKVLEDEAEARREAAVGAWHRARGQTRHISAEICASVDDEIGRPMREILRAWCGASTADVHDELTALRGEASILESLLDDAIGVLREKGHAREANRIESKRTEAGFGRRAR